MPYAGEMHFRDSLRPENDRDALILIHGAGGSYLYWPPEIRRLPGTKVIAVDLPGHGESGGNCQESIKGYADALFNFMDQLEIDRAVLGGHSMGSAIALRMSLDSPERVAGLVLVGAGAKLRVHPQLIQDCSSPETYPQAVAQIMAWSFGQQADQKLLRLAGERMKALSPDVLAADFMACDAFDIRQEVGNIHQPALIICGEEDQMTPVKFSAYLAGEIDGSRLAVIPGAGHMVMLEKPQVVARLMGEYLAQMAG